VLAYLHLTLSCQREIEVELSRLSAQAAGQLLGKHQAQAQAEQNAQTQQDPIVQMQQAELQIKQKEVEIKEKQMIVDASAQADKLALEREKMELEMEKEGMRIGAQTAQAKAKLESQQQLEVLKAGVKQGELQAKQQAEGLRAGIDVAKTQFQMQQTQQPKGEGGEVGSRTDQTTTAGRPVYRTDEGKNVSELSVTLPINGKWVNVPSIHDGKEYSEDALVKMLKAGEISPTSVHNTVEDAVKSAKDRSNKLLGE
jgi:hypothetical protein